MPTNPAVFPAGSPEGNPFPVYSPADFRHSWSWRRSYCAGNTSLDAVNVGDVTQQNELNDLDTAYLFPPIATLHKDAWDGGVNHTALVMLEQRAYGYYGLMVNSSPVADYKPRITLNTEVSGTGHGLSKFPYLR